MYNKMIKILPWVTFTGFVVSLLILLLMFSQRTQMLQEDPQNKITAQQSLQILIDLHPASLDVPTFQENLSAMLHSPVATIWLFDMQGKLVYSAGSTAIKAAAQGHVKEMAGDEMIRILAMLDEQTLNEQQRILLLAASGIQAEGEHNDIYRHLLREVRTSEGQLLGWVGIAYEVNSQINQPGMAWITSTLGFLLALAIYWLSLPLWVYLDARQRHERSSVWAVFVLLGNLAALLAYLLVRQPIANTNAS